MDFSLETGSRIGTMFAVMATAIAICAVLYFWTFRVLRTWQWMLLLFLRAVAIVLVVLLLFRPFISFHKDLEEKPSAIFIIDRSKSMSVADDASGETRFALAKRQIEKWWEKLGDDFDLHLVEFSDTARQLQNPDALAASQPDGAATSIYSALEQARKCAPGRRVEAAILLSDGINNTAKSPLEIAGKLPFVVHTVGVGASLRNSATYRDLQVTGIDCPDRMMLNNKAIISAGIEGIGLPGHVTKVALLDNDQQIEEKELTIDDIEGPQKVEFEILPTVKGRHKFTVTVAPSPSEKIVENNQRSAISIVMEPGIRVLYLEGSLRAEYGTLVQRFLSKDPDLEFCSMIQTKHNVFSRRTNMQNLELNAIPTKPEEIQRFDVFLIGDLDSTYLKPAQQELIVKRVRDGGGLIMLGGYHSLGPGGYDKTPIGEILPVRLGSREIGQMTDTFVPTLTPEGVVHPIFTNVLPYFPTRQTPPKIAGLPPLDGCTRIEGPKPGASVLAIYPNEQGGMPVLAVAPVNKGRVAVFAGDTTWKWQQVPRALGQETPFLQFWGQMIRWAAGRASDVKNEASIIGTADKGAYLPEEPILLSAVVRDQKGEGTSKAKVVAHIAGPAGRTDDVALSTVQGPEGHYEAQFEPKVSGNLKIVIEAKIDDISVSCEPIVVEVGRPNLELEKLDLDERLLNRIAADAKGRYMHISTADRLAAQLDNKIRLRREFGETKLYSPPWFWCIFVVAISAEWFLRKRFQMR